ncbi:non-ribosomal peptide synthetase [Xanthomonas hortorum pv. vitians]|uniref:Dimodular nonribosomal peptide synthase n=1 Tax=Xanthomonas hortorum pv. vitians TaxID=83224 RepID=A0A6V7CDQ9_9XANT|nr:non-ribosomal peptide synthetase [Xanthomonas hortorum]APP83277.1 non-ribosomal peptide synthetase [Xanthomonas hortorum pv. gardneri]ASW46899.1 non-ribosomal peptide synthetase [Xanthomonas hortorum]MCC8494668.1 non-ribosomal peptide synthetase [Xanthomonas hortorum pv. gardneri]MCE4279035.1 non-ribosomal peptide synthetase [Xanthomonas hortorum pv. vitians]MCE4285267.1 non-ribosomal peptide synthetase [Xanthomonas hortorum pv. vitians]
MHAEVSAVIPLTKAQRGLWVVSKLHTDNTLMLSEALEMFGPLDPQLLLRASMQLTREFDTLRLCIVEHDGVPGQVIRPDYTAAIPYFNVSEDPFPRDAAEHWLDEKVRKPDNLQDGPLWHCAVFRLGEDHHMWVHCANHLVVDGYSGSIMMQRMAALYNAYAEGVEPEPAQFGSALSLMEWEQQYLDSDRLQRDRAYWMQQLADLPPPTTLSRLGSHPSTGLLRSTGYFSPQQVVRLHALGKQYGASLPQMLISLIAAYYYRCTGAEDLVLAMPVTGRINARYRKTAGMVANLISLRLKMDPQQPLHTLFTQVSSVVRHALRHQQYRYEDLRRDLGMFGIDQNVARLAVNIEPFDCALRFGEASAIPHNLSNGRVDDLTIFCYERGDGAALRFDLDANPAMYDSDELAEHCRRLTHLADAVLADPECALGLIDVLGHDERQRLLHTWNDTAAPLPEPSTLLHGMLQRAELMPAAVVVQYDNRTLDYATLCELASRVAAQWVADGVGPGDVVAIALPRSEQLLVALLAVMWSGAAYLPLDPESPAARNRQMLNDSGAIALVCEPALCERYLLGGMVWLDPRPAVLPAAIAPLATPDGTAYVLYTSGSTGAPKGVEISHRNLFNFLHAMEHELALRPRDRVLAVTTITFDIAGLELYLPLLVGARVVIAPAGITHDPRSLSRLIAHEQISVVQATPSLWRILLANEDLALDRIHALVGGEALVPELATQLLSRVGRLTQLYGPTETTIWSTIMPLQLTDAAAPPIGRPLLNTRVYVLDAQRQPLPTGAIGELYIGGAGVAKGYRGKRQLTSERFVRDPFADDGSSMYRTGDRVRQRRDGMLEFIGRADAQLKIRGHRVEPAEIENALLLHSQVAQAVVVGHSDGDNNALQLLAYVVGKHGTMPSTELLRAHLQQRLPASMIPTLWMPLEALPLTPNGKLDRRALPSPGALPQRAHVAPRDALEHQLAAMLQDVLGIEVVGVEDNFFELGGDSLRAAEMAARFPQMFGVELPLGTLFHAPTIAGLAEVIKRSAQTPNDPLGVLLPLRAGTPGTTPLFCIHPVVGLGWSYLTLLGQLDPQWPVYALQSPALSDPQHRPESIEAIARDYLARLRSVQPHGPYRLIGWSLGGLIAHAITAELHALGEEVELLAMLDSYPYLEQAAALPESEMVHASMHALGLDVADDKTRPTTLAELASLLCDHYLLNDLPALRQLLTQHPTLLDDLGGLTQHHLQLSRRHRPKPLQQDVLFVEARVRMSFGGGDAVWLDYRPQAWQPYVRNLHLHVLDSDHHSMLSSTHSATLSALLHAATAKAAQRDGSTATASDGVAEYA